MVLELVGTVLELRPLRLGIALDLGAGGRRHGGAATHIQVELRCIVPATLLAAERMPTPTLSIDLSVLPSPQRAVWDDLVQVPRDFTLYGGTAIALQLGHRQSMDYDLFSSGLLAPRKLLDELPFLVSCEVLLQNVNTLTVLVHRDGPVQVSFFGLPRLRRVRVPQRAHSNGLAVASLLHLAATKVEVVQARAERKDYLDIDALLERTQLTLPDMLAAAAAVFGGRFNPQITLKALSHFADVSGGVPPDVQARLALAARRVDLDNLPHVVPILDVAP